MVDTANWRTRGNLQNPNLHAMALLHVGMRTASPDNPWPHEPQLRNNKSNGKENGNYRDYRAYIGDTLV